ncbi:tRNA (adenosine(37)-N6)-threonylcarbamoyltransferase complex ATPase subunit type 1 TsaE [Egibacter rhizosphaerae]|uniref:tRNA threonylcarbamoyladenosine biosynthesis protein TsaE n=1 Tax=Egibacter rhizosphaerae TaxID=1670831 RepID=A0A411YHI7_9ACTN|nr:tRNA (adenosine(37)-N6)-threonylcarbamoyltransferase complex ATPase subunit type 1 TsaE [Egibacter rhizosphaerae]QBI20581.1 tRNA (adenosine(37)-N6)-threonylcarbamoyltransferase complex ATPase subunit type 1 TsaE [Egibacter rhizosphaerae]
MDLATSDPHDTRRFAAALAGLLEPGDLVSLTGELGAGKTCVAQGVAAALGVTEPVTSPSFLLRRDYAGRVPLVHLDVYRLETLEEVLDTGWLDAADEAVVLVEWGDAVQPLLPADHVEVELALADPASVPSELGAPEPRRVRVRAHGPRWAARRDELHAVLAPWRNERRVAAGRGGRADDGGSRNRAAPEGSD